MTDDKKSIENRPNWLLIISLVLVTLAVNAVVVNHLINTRVGAALASFTKSGAIPRVVTMDRGDLVRRMQESSADKLRILHAMQALETMMEQDGYLVLDSEAVLIAPNQYVIKEFTLEDIEAIAKERGIKADEQTTQMIEAADRQAQQVLEQLQQQFDAMRRQQGQ